MNPDFETIFARLRSILEPHSTRLKVTANEPGHYCLEIPFSPKLNKGFPVAWVNTCKNYVSYYLMPVYMFPSLRDSMSEKLRARMQGKSCFNFKVADDALFRELEQLTAKGFAVAKDDGLDLNESARGTRMSGPFAPGRFGVRVSMHDGLR